MDAKQLKPTRTYIVCLLVLFGLAFSNIAITSAQAMTITLPATIDGTLAANGTADYTFTALSGTVISVSVRTTDENFDPVVTILDNAERVIISNDDYNYPETRNALLEAVSLPRIGTYIIRVSGYDGTAGDYTLRVYPGFSEIGTTDDFSAESEWDTLSDALSTTIESETLTLEINGMRAVGSTFYQYVDPVPDLYVQADVLNVTNPSGWVVGLAARRQGDNYYMLSINNTGLWRFSLVEGESETILRDWTPHPNIVAGQQAFTIGLAANANGFDFFYNGGFIGSVSDSTLSRAGQVGLVAGTTSSLPTTTTVSIDNLVITTPHFINGERIIPQDLIISTAVEMERALELRHVVSANGEMALTVPSSSVEYARAGINRLMLGRGTTYANFALGTMINIQGSQRGLAGCGLVLRYTGENDYVLAYLDQMGGYGISQRQDEEFLPGLFGEITNWTSNTSHHLLIIANDDRLFYYIDGKYVGALDVPAQTGEVGTAVVNFETITTTCQYTDLWLWRWN